MSERIYCGCETFGPLSTCLGCDIDIRAATRSLASRIARLEVTTNHRAEPEPTNPPTDHPDVDRLLAQPCKAPGSMDYDRQADLLRRCVVEFKKMEWVCTHPVQGAFCGCCGSPKSAGHAPDCQLAAILKDAREAGVDNG